MGGLLHGVRPLFGEGPDTSITSVTGAGVPHVLFATAPELERGDVLGGRFQIEAVIGSGGSGRVLRAFDRQSRMLVALKILRTEFAEDPIWNERFSRELRVGRTITHPNVCRVFDIGDADGHKFLSMELAPGGCIRSDVPKATTPGVAKPTRAWDDRVVDAQAMVAGVAALHGAGIVHRDIKPENILRMEDGRLVVTDFGLATDPGSGPGNTVMVGTPSYMAPEVVMGDPATLRSDVWGMGVVLHEILFAGRPQWKAAGRGYRRFVLPPVATPAERAVAELCGRCVSDVAELRPASAMELQQALVVALRGTRVLSRRRRRQIGWGALAVVALSTLGLMRDRWTNSARASSAQAAASLSERVLTPTGTPADWSKGATKLASFAGRLHCYSLVDGGRKVRAIWGTPRKAEDVDVKTGERTPSELLPETYQDGCPVVSPDGKRLLFEKTGETGTHVYVTSSPDGRDARQIVRGSEPTWLPNSEEFVFVFDARHAAMFSLPTGTMTLVAERDGDQLMVTGQAVDDSGTRLAIRYATNDAKSLVVFLSLPSLKPVGRALLPFSSGPIAFDSDPDRHRLIFSHEGANGLLHLGAVDWTTQAVTSLASSGTQDLNGVVGTGRVGGLFVVGDFKRDLWKDEGKELRRLTEDGDSFHGALSSRGVLAIQKRLANGQRAIFLRKVDGHTQQITHGPTDITPSFFPDGETLVYADVQSNEIVRCWESSGRCQVIVRDELMPGFPSVDPAGTRVAYVTLSSSPRIRVTTLDGHQRDLGPVGETCAPIWNGNSKIWIAQATATVGTTWVELDVTTGQRTGKVEVARVAYASDCPVPSGLAADSTHLSPPRVFAITEQSAALVSRTF